MEKSHFRLCEGWSVTCHGACLSRGAAAVRTMQLCRCWARPSELFPEINSPLPLLHICRGCSLGQSLLTAFRSWMLTQRQRSILSLNTTLLSTETSPFQGCPEGLSGKRKKWDWCYGTFSGIVQEWVISHLLNLKLSKWSLSPFSLTCVHCQYFIFEHWQEGKI